MSVRDRASPARTGPLASTSITGLTRRQALGGVLAGAAAVALAGCSTGARPGAADGSTLHSTWIDARGDGQLSLGPGEPLIDRVALGKPAPITGTIARLAHLTDAHVLDASSPARVPFLARLGPPLQSTFRPQEALTAQVLNGAVSAIRALRPELVIQGGDLIDNDQNNELERALKLLTGGRVHPGSGRDGYYGVQSLFDPDPFYYRPDIDAPRHPGMLKQAVRPFTSAGLGIPWLPVLGDHDALVAGELTPSALTQGLAVGDRALWNLPPNLELPRGLRLSPGGSPDGPPDPGYVASFLRQALAGPTVHVPADRNRYELSFTQAIGRLWSGSHAGTQTGIRAAATASAGAQLDYVRDVGDSLRLIVLDIVRRGGGSGGLVADDQPAWLSEQLSSAGDRWVIVVSHQPLPDATGGEQLLALLDRAPRVVAVLSGHTHRNRIVPRETAAGGYWLITTCSLIDYPQQCRALHLHATANRGVALQTWMLDHAGDDPLGPISRELAYIDAQGGRPAHFTGSRWDRNVTLYRSAPR
jgi:3',5'-cyclic AMP phosphodiesterase CpdA